MTASRAPIPVAGEDLARVAWRISSRSDAAGGSCVEAGPFTDGTGRVAVRHSHNRENGAVIVYTRAEWDAFIAGVKDNEFDVHA